MGIPLYLIKHRDEKLSAYSSQTALVLRIYYRTGNHDVVDFENKHGLSGFYKEKEFLETCELPIKKSNFVSFKGKIFK